MVLDINKLLNKIVEKYMAYPKKQTEVPVNLHINKINGESNSYSESKRGRRKNHNYHQSWRMFGRIGIQNIDN